jgi:hypothetical protein
MVALFLNFLKILKKSQHCPFTIITQKKNGKQYKFLSHCKCTIKQNIKKKNGKMREKENKSVK